MKTIITAIDSATIISVLPSSRTGHRQVLTSLAAIGGLMAGPWAGLACAQPTGLGAQRAIFATKAEAEAAAKQFNCKGAHRMGNQWMPCASHGEASDRHPSPVAH